MKLLQTGPFKRKLDLCMYFVGAISSDWKCGVHTTAVVHPCRWLESMMVAVDGYMTYLKKPIINIIIILGTQEILFFGHR
jgi:hypothetical protein